MPRNPGRTLGTMPRRCIGSIYSSDTVARVSSARARQLDFAVLGLLHDGPAHGYELRRELATALGPFRSLSYGTLYPALKSLLERGLIAPEDAPTAAVPAARQKIAYRLTDEGSAAFADLVAQTDSAAYDDDGFDVRFAFFGRTQHDVRLRILEGRRSRSKSTWTESVSVPCVSAKRWMPTPRPGNGTVRRPPSVKCAGSANSSTPSGVTRTIPAHSPKPTSGRGIRACGIRTPHHPAHHQPAHHHMSVRRTP